MTPLRVADLNLRPPHATARAVEWCSLSPWVKINADELRVLGNEMRPPNGLTPRYYYNSCWWEASDPNQVLIVTDGPNGVTVVAGKGDEFHEPGVPASVVDTVGAGDAFTAAMVCLHLEGKSLRDCARFAVHYAARVCEASGGTPKVNRAEVERAAGLSP